MRWSDLFLQSKWMEWRHLLEMANGLWLIVAIYLIVFISYHLIRVGAQRRLKLRGWLSLPLSMQLAVGMLVVALGVVLTRAVIWVSRFSNNGNVALQSVDTAFFFIGTVIGLWGFMCILRVVTKPVLGHWPWISALAWCVVYVVWSLIRLR